jgi:lysophospholipase L1-like esterase
MVAGRLGVRFPGMGLRFANRGVGGNTIVDLTERWQTDAIDLAPSVISILVGINDAVQGVARHAPDRFESDYAELIERTRAELPDARIVVGEPFALGAGYLAREIEDFRERLRPYREAVERVAKRNGIVLIRYQSAFDEACKLAPPGFWCWDGIHATPAGHELMAREWMRAVGL